MSHLKTTIAGKTPNTQGEITVTPEDLSDVSVTSLANGEVLTYDSTSGEWKNTEGTIYTTAAGLQMIVVSSEPAESGFFTRLHAGGGVTYLASDPKQQTILPTVDTSYPM